MHRLNIASAAMEVEDQLQEAGIYRSMVDDSPRHMDSYGTLTDCVRLIEWWNEHQKDHSDADWMELAGYWDFHSYCSPNASQLASFIKRRVGKVAA